MASQSEVFDIVTVSGDVVVKDSSKLDRETPAQIKFEVNRHLMDDYIDIISSSSSFST